ncbi:MAG: phosphotransferase [Prevotellaceae bacterium]|nr:phosphotransferase [Candidatus Faecinaster equi]
MEKLISLFEEYYGEHPAKVVALEGAGSNRKYFRMYFNGQNAHAQSVIGVIGTSKEENESFIYLSKFFKKKHQNVPEVYAVSKNKMMYIQEDLGTISLYQAIAEGRANEGKYSNKEKTLLKKTIHILPSLQYCGVKGLNYKKCYPQEAFDKQNVMFDLNYFKYCFLKFIDIDFNEISLEKDFQAMADNLVKDNYETFMYRDFQVRNIMLKDGQPYFIDFQGGRRGPAEYDLVSFLWQSSAKYSPTLRKELINEYIEGLSEVKSVTINEICKLQENIEKFLLFRILQVLGAYGFRGYHEKKQYFIDSIPLAINNLKEILRYGGCPYPYLNRLLKQLVNHRQFNTIKKPTSGTMSRSKYDGSGPLKVRVFSFSYKKGIPDDTSGNGGGYVFDCRCTHNPGRYDEYKKLTGLDTPVIKFIEEDGELPSHLENIYKIVDRHVQRYIEREFTDLMFSFGCTGGQHRSVYSAQHVADYIRKKYGIEVILYHRELGING